MFDKSNWKKEGQEVWQGEEQDTTAIEDIELHGFEWIPGYRFVVGLLVFLSFFLVPIPIDGQVTILFDVVLNLLVGSFTVYLSWIGVGIAIGCGLLTVVALLNYHTDYSVKISFVDLEYWRTSIPLSVVRILGVVFLVVIVLRIGPGYLRPPLVEQLGGEFVPLVVVLVPTGAILVKVLVESGGLHFVGTFARPLMKPLYSLPGRSVLDALASLIGAGVVGLYVTYDVFNQGSYNKKHVYILVTCFAANNVANLLLGTALLDIVNLFPFVFVSWILSLLLTALIVVRLPPITHIPKDYIKPPDQETVLSGSASDYFRLAVSEAMEKSKDTTLPRSMIKGGLEGAKIAALAACIAIGFIYPVFLAFEYTNLMEVIALPLMPVIEFIGIPDSQIVSLSVISSIGAGPLAFLVASGPGVQPMAAFFIVVFSMSTIIYLSATAPIALDIFRDVPIRARDLAIIWITRVVILIPLVSLMTHVLNIAGVFG